MSSEASHLTQPATVPLLYLDGVHVSFDGFRAINNLSLTIEPGETREIVVLLGAAASEDEARAIIGRHAQVADARAAVDAAIAGAVTLTVVEPCSNGAGSDLFAIVWDGTGLALYSTGNQDSPLMQSHVPLLGIDVWEHAYYLKYQNKRAAYLEAWWNVVDWGEVARRFAEATAS